MKTSNLELSNLIQGFTLSCQTEGKSPRTIEWYASFLTRFYHFLNSNGLPVNANLIEKHHIRAFIRYLQTEAKTPMAEEHFPLLPYRDTSEASSPFIPGC